MWVFGKKREHLLEWQRIVTHDSGNQLFMTESQLREISNQQASNDLRIVNDCTRILSETVKPDVFFSRLDVLKQASRRLMELEPYIKFTGVSPTVAYNELNKQEQTIIYQFIGRYFTSVYDKAESMKTERGKKNQYEKFFDSLQPYFDRMDQHNKNYVVYKIKNRT